MLRRKSFVQEPSTQTPGLGRTGLTHIQALLIKEKLVPNPNACPSKHGVKMEAWLIDAITKTEAKIALLAGLIKSLNQP